MCTLELRGYSLCSAAVAILRRVYTLVSKTAPDVFLQGGDKCTGQLNEMCNVLVMCAEEKNEQKREIRNIGDVAVRLL